MDNLGPILETYTGTWGPAALLAVATILFFTGKIVAMSTVNKLLAGKDEQLRVQKEFYEGRIRDILAGHVDLTAELRHTRDTLEDTLTTSVSNTHSLIAQINELQELTRTTSAAILGARAAAERNGE